MVNSIKFACGFLTDRRGTSGAEYALLLSLVGTLFAMSVVVLGNTITSSIDNTSDLIEQAGCNNNGQGTGLGGGNGGSGGQGSGNGIGNNC